MPFILLIANFFGISVFRLAAYAVIVVAVIITGVTLRNHYVNKGWNNAIAAVKKQDDRAVHAAEKVQEKAAKCDETNGYWDVVTQNCRLEDAK